jgi:hypothetical protein
MATWVTGETPAAAKFQALDDRVTAVENFDAGIKRGFYSGNAGTNGQVTVAHGLGATPVAAFAIMNDSANSVYVARIVSFDSTNIVVAIRNSSSGAQVAAGQSAPFYWLALA